MQQITELKYNVLMQAIKHAQISHFDDEFVDPYAGDEFDYTHSEVKKALEDVERLIQNTFLTDDNKK